MTVLEVIERSIYQALLEEGVKQGVCLDPSKYHPVTPATTAQYKKDVEELGSKLVNLYGASSSKSKGIKQTPSIVIESHGFYPGGIGLPGKEISEQGNRFKFTESPTETLHQYLDVRLVATNQADNRILHTLLFNAIPQRGYLKPFYSKVLLPTGNIYIELENFMNQTSTQESIIEKTYQFRVTDLVMDLPQIDEIVAKINSIEVQLDNLS